MVCVHMNIIKTGYQGPACKLSTCFLNKSYSVQSDKNRFVTCKEIFRCLVFVEC